MVRSKNLLAHVPEPADVARPVILKKHRGLTEAKATRRNNKVFKMGRRPPSKARQTSSRNPTGSR